MAIEHKDIASIRADYSKFELSEDEVLSNPIQQFEVWFEQALAAKVNEPNAMALSTINANGFPTSRIVLLKDIKPNGFNFFTNYHSHKGADILGSPKVSLLFFWEELQRQVRIVGLAEQVPGVESDEYFVSRPIGSQVGAWSSPQSEIIPNRDFLDQRVQATQDKFEGQDVLPRPDFWGGYIVQPLTIEFWQGRSSRLHDRIQYTLEDSGWVINRLAP